MLLVFETEIEFKDLSQSGSRFYIMKTVYIRSFDSNATIRYVIVTHLTTFPYRREQIKCSKLVSRGKKSTASSRLPIDL